MTSERVQRTLKGQSCWPTCNNYCTGDEIQRTTQPSAPDRKNLRQHLKSAAGLGRVGLRAACGDGYSRSVRMQSDVVCGLDRVGANPYGVRLERENSCVACAFSWTRAVLASLGCFV